jgi:hypothetical protein
MTAEEIVNKIEREQPHRVVIRWKGGSNKPASVKGECWAMTVTNEPDLFFQEKIQSDKIKANHCSKIEIESVEEGIQLYHELNAYFNNPEMPTPEVGAVDPSKPLYLAIYIHYHIQ